VNINRICPRRFTFFQHLFHKLQNAILLIIMELIRSFYTTFIFLILPHIVKILKQGTLPRPPFILSVIHVGNFDPAFVARASGHYRVRAIYEMDGGHPFVRFFFEAFWRFQVTRDPTLKDSLNRKTMRKACRHLRKGGTVMIFPEGYRRWERKLHPGVAVMAHRANVSIIPVGIENGATFRPEQPPLRALRAAIKDYYLLKWVRIHFASPIYPRTYLSEREDVEELMNLVKKDFDGFYERFYGISGPVWTTQDHDGVSYWSEPLRLDR